MDLLDFSNEILLQICENLSDIELVNVSRVCKRLKEIAKETVGKLLSGDSDWYYRIKLLDKDGPKVHWAHREFLETFSGQVHSLDIFMEKRINKRDLMKLILQHCRSLKYVKLRGLASQFPVSKLMQSLPNLCSITLDNVKCANLIWMDQRFPYLETLHLDNVSGIDPDNLKQFMCINPQLKHLKVVTCADCPLNSLEELRNHLKGLESLEFRSGSTEVVHNYREIFVPNMERLELTVHGSSATAKVLSAFGRSGNKISHLEVTYRSGDIDAEHTLNGFKYVISLFDKLTSLEIRDYKIGARLIEILARKLPNLVKMELSDVQLDELSTDQILYVFERCKTLEELRLESNTEHVYPDEQFNLEFHQKFAKIARDCGKKMKLEISPWSGNVTITEEKIVKDDILLYWTGCEASLSRSDVHLFDLNEKVLHNIYDYLDESAQRALYETCTKMKTALQERIRFQWFTVSNEKTAKDLFGRFGEHITKLKIDMKTNNRQQMTETWKIIDERGSKQITEMSLNNVNVDATGSLAVEFPQLTLLKVISTTSKMRHIFPLMQCPKIRHLEFDRGDIIFPNRTTYFGFSTNNLTTIRVNHYNDSTHKVLSQLDQQSCYQIKEFTVEHNSSRTVKVVNMSMRFRNLVTLNLVCSSLKKTNVEYLFQSCTKLRKLSLGNVPDYDYDELQRIIRCIKENCKQLELIQCEQCCSEHDHSALKQFSDALPNVEVKEFRLVDDNFRIRTVKPPKASDRKKPF